MEVHFEPAVQARLEQLSQENGQSVDQLVKDLVSGYLGEHHAFQKMLDDRYDDIASGRVEPITGEELFSRLQKRIDAHKAAKAGM